MTFHEFLNIAEMPLRNFKLVPPHNPESKKSPWSPSAKKLGWGDQDAKIVTSEGGVRKFHKLFDNTEFLFDFYLVKTAKTKTIRETGLVSDEWVNENVPELRPFRSDEEAITVIYTGNFGDQRVPFTAWTAAHRFGHAVQRSPQITQWHDFTRDLEERMAEIIEDYYGVKHKTSDFLNRTNALKQFATNIGTMKSARQNNISRYYEFNYELLAQFLTTRNKVSFNTEVKKLVSRYVFGNPIGVPPKASAAQNPESVKEDMDHLANYCNDMLGEVMRQCTSCVFVM